MVARLFTVWYTRRESNPRHLVPETSALSTELRVHTEVIIHVGIEFWELFIHTDDVAGFV